MRMTGKAFATRLLSFLMAALIAAAPGVLRAEIAGVTGTSFNLVASEGHITTADGDSILTWGYGLAEGGNMQYPGPTLLVNQGDAITVNLTNNLEVPVSLIFPGQRGVSAEPVSGESSEGLLTLQAEPGATVRYSFSADHAGTYLYHSGTRPDLQVEMGLVGALIVRPAAANQAYAHPDTAFDHEYLFLLSQMDPSIHQQVAFGGYDQVDMTGYDPVLWFINGRSAPDTLLPNHTPWLPFQPYNSFPRTRPGERVLMRVIGGDNYLHPFHTHGNHMKLVARDGRLLESTPGAGADLAREDYTLQVVPGATYDALWHWTGEKLGWDIYGTGDGYAHDCIDTTGDGFDDTTHEWCEDHGKPLPVVLPELQDLTFGGFYSGSPFLGAFGTLPVGEGGLNLHGGLFFMWHSHTEKELVNNDIFPGGMMTMMVVEPPGTPIP